MQFFESVRAKDHRSGLRLELPSRRRHAPGRTGRLVPVRTVRLVPLRTLCLICCIERQPEGAESDAEEEEDDEDEDEVSDAEGAAAAQKKLAAGTAALAKLGAGGAVPAAKGGNTGPMSFWTLRSKPRCSVRTCLF